MLKQRKLLFQHYLLKLKQIRKKYTEYEKSVKNYLTAKSDKIEIKDKKGDIEKLNSKIAELEEVK